MALMGAKSFTAQAESGVWQHVQTQVLASPAASVSFTGLAGAAFYMLAAHISKDSSAGGPTVLVRLNNDSATNYAASRLNSADGDVRTGSAVATQTSFATVATLVALGTSIVRCYFSKPAAGVRGQMISQAGIQMAASDPSQQIDRIFGDWGNTTATISRIDILLSTNNMAAGTSVRLDQKAAA